MVLWHNEQNRNVQKEVTFSYTKISNKGDDIYASVMIYIVCYTSR